MRTLFVAILLLATLLPPALHARPGDLDGEFADFGVYTPPLVCCGMSRAYALLRLPTGQLVMGGDAGIEGEVRPTLVRVDATGLPDNTFGTQGVVRLQTLRDGRILALARDSAGRIVAGGTYLDQALALRPFFARFGADGALDPTFGSGGIRTLPALGGGFSATFVGMQLLADGRIVFAGNLGMGPSADGDIYVARLDAAGHLDPAFGTAGLLRSNIPGVDLAGAIAVAGDGRIAVVGTWFQPGGGRVAVMRLTAEGAFDATFGGGVRTLSPQDAGAYAAQFLPDGRMLVAGYVSSTAFTTRLLADGVPDPGYGTDGMRTLGPTAASSLALLPDGRHYVLTHTSNSVAIHRLLPDGAPDPSWPGAGLGVTEPFGIRQPAGDIMALPDGGVGVATGPHFTLLALAPDGTALPGFGDNGKAVAYPGRAAPQGEYRALAMRADGSFAVSDGSTIEKHTAQGALDVSFASSGRFTPPAPGVEALAAHTNGGWLYAYGILTTHSRSTALRRLHADGSADATFGNPSVEASTAGSALLTTYPDGRILFGTPGGGFRRYSASGQPDAAFNGGLPVAGELAALDGSRVVVAFASGRVERRLESGAPDAAFAGGGGLSLARDGDAIVIQGLAVQPDGAIVIGGRQFAARIPLVARITAAGTLDASFGNGGFVDLPYLHPNTSVPGIAIDAEGRIVVGGTESDPVRYRGFVARLAPDGMLDTGFGTGGMAHTDVGPGNESVRALSLQPTGRIVAAGQLYTSPGLFGVEAAPSAIRIANDTLRPGGVGVPYVQSLGAEPGAVFTLAGGELPPGMRVEDNYFFRGTPEAYGIYEIALRATQFSSGATDTRLYTFIVHDVASLVRSYYLTILGRDGDIDGRAFWGREVQRLAAAGARPEEAFFVLAAIFFNGAEYRGRNLAGIDYVSDLYRTFFLREPDGPGRAYWVSQLEAGMPREALLNAFMFSPEFAGFLRGVFGPNTTPPEISLAVDFYRGLLQRLPDDDGLAYWAARFRAAQCAGSVVPEADAISRLFLESPEYAQVEQGRVSGQRTRQFVVDLYKAFLRRGTDAAGFQYWVEQLDSGARSREEVRRLFVASPEFQQRVAAVNDAGCVQ